MVLDLEGKINLDLEDAPAQTNAKVSEETKPLKKLWKPCWLFGLQGNGTQENQKFFEGTTDTAENYIKSALKMLVK